ncbi:MAG: hypothetical protein ACYSW7_08395 [Planctomycetota bacterium]|jgi:hypothetical protein
MKSYMKIVCATAILIFFSASNLYPYSGPFEGRISREESLSVLMGITTMKMTGGLSLLR